MTDLRKLAEECLRLDGEATGGPWVQFMGSVQQSPSFDKPLLICEWPDGCVIGDKSAKADHDLIAHYRSSAPTLAKALLVAMEALQAINDSVKGAYDMGEIASEGLKAMGGLG